MNFEEFLTEGKLYATSKDGVRKQVKNDAEAHEWRETIAKQPKEKAARAAKTSAFDLGKIARIIEAEVGNHYPDSDGFDAIKKQVQRLYPHVRNSWDVTELLNKAAKKELKSKSYGEYVDDFHTEQGK